MFSLNVVAVLALGSLSRISCSVLAPAVAAHAVPAIRYSLVAPQNIRPFAAQVGTFTKGLSVYAAPYAAGVIGGPAIVPAPALAPAPGYPVVAPAPAVPAAVAPASLYHGYPSGFAAAAVPAVATAAVPVAAAPVAPAWPAVAPAHLLPAPFARSIHAVTPGLAPAFGPHIPASAYLG